MDDRVAESGKTMYSIPPAHSGTTRTGANLALGGEKRANVGEAIHRTQATRRRAGCQSLVAGRAAGSAGWRRSHLLP